MIFEDVKLIDGNQAELFADGHEIVAEFDYTPANDTDTPADFVEVGRVMFPGNEQEIELSAADRCALENAILAAIDALR